MNPKELKDHIVFCIGDDIGTYTYKNGVLEAAIAVGNIPNDTSVEGVEVILPLFPNIDQSYQYGDTYHHRCEKWDVILVLHGNNKASFFTAIDKLNRYFSRSYGNYISPNSITKSLPQYCFTIKYSEGYRKINGYIPSP